ncbi:type II toxin-antitoxin system VapC family toxin [Granulicella aggregans]|uniref:type II toxin-antitoxin system VapC family toxin n=1 Tax=Granulicella aggregans TaxID=474949 RepID=UPI00295B2226|nr:type II toxin-antitoxin system VapC family toxin [Granulicella aggregans]
MRYLLDSHAVVWAIYSPDRLSPLATTLLSDLSNEFVVSHVTLQELLNKVGRGKLPIAGTSLTGVFARIQRLSDSFLPVTLDHILAAASLPQIHHDPGDRLLVAQALAESIPLMTLDPEIREYAVPTIW